MQTTRERCHDTQECKSALSFIHSHKSWFQILQIQFAPPPDLSSDVFLNLVNSSRNSKVTLLLDPLAKENRKTQIIESLNCSGLEIVGNLGFLENPKNLGNHGNSFQTWQDYLRR